MTRGAAPQHDPRGHTARWIGAPGGARVVGRGRRHEAEIRGGLIRFPHQIMQGRRGHGAVGVVDICERNTQTISRALSLTSDTMCARTYVHPGRPGSREAPPHPGSRSTPGCSRIRPCETRSTGGRGPRRTPRSARKAAHHLREHAARASAKEGIGFTRDAAYLRPWPMSPAQPMSPA